MSIINNDDTEISIGFRKAILIGIVIGVAFFLLKYTVFQ